MKRYLPNVRYTNDNINIYLGCNAGQMMHKQGQKNSAKTKQVLDGQKQWSLLKVSGALSLQPKLLLTPAREAEEGRKSG